MTSCAQLILGVRAVLQNEEKVHNIMLSSKKQQVIIIIIIIIIIIKIITQFFIYLRAYPAAHTPIIK
jgi:hypothetical protein